MEAEMLPRLDDCRLKKLLTKFSFYDTMLP